MQEGVTIVGRGKDADITIDSPKLSRVHARFIVEAGKISMEDLDSKNGIFVNGERIQGKRELTKGDRIKLADIECEITFPDIAVSAQGENAQEMPATSSVKMLRSKNRKKKEMIKNSFIVVVLVFGLLALLYYIKTYIPEAQKNAQETISTVKIEIPYLKVTEDLKTNTELLLKLQDMKESVALISDKFEIEYKKAQELIIEIEKQQKKIEAKNKSLQAIRDAWAAFKSIVESIDNNTLSVQEAVSKLNNLRVSFPQTEIAVKAAQKLNEIQNRIYEEEKKIFDSTIVRSQELAKAGQFRQALAVIDNCLGKEFMDGLENEREVLTSFKKRIPEMARERFLQYIKNTVAGAYTDDCDALKEALEKEYRRMGLSMLEEEYHKAMARIDEIKAERVALARAKVEKEISEIGNLQKKRMYKKAAGLYKVLIPKITEPELKKEIEDKKRINDLYTVAKKTIMTYINREGGVNIVNVGFIKYTSETEIKLEIDEQTMPVPWDKIRDNEFLGLVSMAMKKHSDAQLFTAYAVLLLARNRVEEGDVYFWKALSASTAIESQYHGLFDGYRKREAQRKAQEKEEKEKKEKEKKEEEAEPERVAYYDPAQIKKIYYVSPSGSDGAPGTLQGPWKTIGKANSKVQPGEMVVIREGMYNETIRPVNSGTEDAPIVFKGYEGEETIIVGSGDKAAWLEDKHYIVLDNLVFDGNNKIKCGVYLHGRASHITVINCIIRNFRNAKNLAGIGIKVNHGGASFLTVENCTIFHNGTTNPLRENGGNIHIFANSDHITIRNCDIYECYTEDGIHLGAFGLVTDVLIENCTFWKNKEDGIDIKLVERVTVRNCEFWGHRKSPTGGGAGIVIHMGARDVTVDRCISHDNMRGIGIAFKTLAKYPATEHIRVQRSVFYNNELGGILVVGGWKREPMPGKLKDVKLYNNVLFRNTGYGIELYAHEGGDVIGVEVKNNIFFENGATGLSKHSDRIKEVTSSHNNYFRDKSQGIGGEKNRLGADPKFMNSDEYDFRLSPSSTLINKGTDVGLPFLGRAPDIGAYEYGEQVKTGD